VGIARAGAGIAYGQSLEGATLNPALLVTLRETSSAYLAAGMEMQSAQATLQSNSNVLFSEDRNRFLPALGWAWKTSPTLAFGLKIDNPFMRHDGFSDAYTGRFQGKSLELTARRIEAQAGWSATPSLSFGVSLGVAQVKYAFSNTVRVQVTDSALSAPSAANPARGLLELDVAQDGSKLLPTYELGFRWAINPRWTLAGTYQGAIQGTLGLSAHVDAGGSRLVGVSGYGPADPIATAAAPAIQAAVAVKPGVGHVTLPGRLSLGLRQRLNQVFTWEADLRYVQATALELPSYPVLSTPGDPVRGSGLPGQLHSGFGVSLMGEMALGKRLTGRLGVSMDPGLHQDACVEPLLGGARNAAFSMGLGWKAWGGELNLGWQVRQSQDRSVSNLDQVWAADHSFTTGTATRVEGMGHLWSIGFKKAF
jgi:hypothetical protein